MEIIEDFKKLHPYKKLKLHIFIITYHAEIEECKIIVKQEIKVFLFKRIYLHYFKEINQVSVNHIAK